MPQRQAGRLASPRPLSALLVLLCLVAAVPGAVPASAEGPAPAGDPAAFAIEAAARAVPKGSEALAGTAGFRSTNPEFVGWYVTTGINQNLNPQGELQGMTRDKKLRARERANPVAFEMGLFRDAGGRFKLLGENGRWVALKTAGAFPDGIFMAAAGRWGAAWGFKVVRPASLANLVQEDLNANGIDPGLPVCLAAYKGRTYRGLATLDVNGFLVLDPAGVCGQSTLALFMTDDLPAGVPLRALRDDPTRPLDEITRARFVAPDRGTDIISPWQENRARTQIDLYFNYVADMSDRIYTGAAVDLIRINTKLSVSSLQIPGEEEEEMDWWGFASDILLSVMTFIPGEVDDQVFATLTILVNVAEAGYVAGTNANLSGPRLIADVTNAQVATVAELEKKLDLENSRTRRNLQMLRLMLREGCESAANCTSDRRLAQWLADPPPDPGLTAVYEDYRRMAYRQMFYETLLPVRGRLAAYWTYVPGSECFDRAFNLEESLGDTSHRGFGTPPPGTSWDEVLLFTSVWRPWNNRKYCWSGVYTSDWPVAQAWVIGLTNNDNAPPTLLVGADYSHITDDLFEPYDPNNPLAGGLGLSYKEVACEWLSGAGPYGYWYEGKWYHPCHIAFYDPTAATPTRVNNIARWLTTSQPTDPNSQATYNSNPYAIAWFVPERHEVDSGRSITDPDIFSWQIPHLEYGSCAATPWPRSAATGAAASVYFANLTDVPVRIRRINADGTRTLIPDTDGTSELEVWTALGHPAGGAGPSPTAPPPTPCSAWTPSWGRSTWCSEPATTPASASTPSASRRPAPSATRLPRSTATVRAREASWTTEPRANRNRGGGPVRRPALPPGAIGTLAAGPRAIESPHQPGEDGARCTDGPARSCEST